MKKNKLIILVLGMNLSISPLFAQNVGVGIANPENKFQVEGNFMVRQALVISASTPTVAQTKTMVNGTTVNFSTTDSLGKLYDPGGPGSNYLANLTAYASISNPGSFGGVEVSIQGTDLGTGDSLLIKTSSSATGYLLAIGHENTTGKWSFNSGGLFIIFKSDANASVGAGFELTFRRIFAFGIDNPPIQGTFGRTFYFDTRTGSLRSGKFGYSEPGDYSSAIGLDLKATGAYSAAFGVGGTSSGSAAFTSGLGNTASGDYSVAFGRLGEASGVSSFALGTFSDASGDYSFVTGFSSNASGESSVALGEDCEATGDNSIAIGTMAKSIGINSVAIGKNCTASGNYSIALGSYVSTTLRNGSLVIGDNSTTTNLTSASDNSFRARFDGGYRFYTSADMTTNCLLANGSNAWSTSSDIRLKENFALANGEKFLQHIANMPLGSWNYKKQDATIFRHYGPMAQDFFSAFGHDRFGIIGNDTTINQADFDGVNLIAIQALEKRTTEQKAMIGQIQTINHDLQISNQQLTEAVQELSRELDKLKKKSKRKNP